MERQTTSSTANILNPMNHEQKTKQNSTHLRKLSEHVLQQFPPEPSNMLSPPRPVGASGRPPIP
jgi:hypothetical protein